MYIFLLFLFLLSGAQAFGDCEAKYDGMRIPHLQVESQARFYYCFGYHHGKDRAWQMDYFRRVAQGRNAEVYGYSHLKADLMMRLVDLPVHAQKLWSSFPTKYKKLLEEYARGANAGFVTGKNSKEFLELNYSPEPWKSEDTIAVLLLQSFDQTRKTFLRDYDEEKFKEEWGEKAESLFSEENMPWENTILKEGEYPKSMSSQKTFLNPKSTVKLWSLFPSVLGEESGSNNWVVSKEKSITGHAMLANDPHLDLKTPIFWYWINIKSSAGQLLGASLPGVPIVASGTNGKVSWGLTNSYINSADANFIKDPSKDLMSDFWPKVQVKIGPFKLPFFFKRFERTKSGLPVLPLELETKHKIVLSWTGFNLSASDLMAMFDFIDIKNVQEMDKVLEKVGLPSWNFVFADTNGDIGFRTVGRAYKHKEKIPFGISALSEAEIRNKKLLSPEEMPHLLKPKRNYIYSANNRHWPMDSAFYGGRGYTPSIRGSRIDELLVGKQDIESFKKIQCDIKARDADYFIPKFKKVLGEEIFSGWDSMATPESKVTGRYRRLMDLVMEKWKVNEYALFRILDDLPPKKIVELREFSKLAEDDASIKKWGELLRIRFPHLSKKSDWSFSPEGPGVGDTYSVNPGTSKWNDDEKIYEQFSGSSMRMIIEMKKTPEVYLTLPGLNRDYQNKSDDGPWDDWRNCKYKRVFF